MIAEKAMTAIDETLSWGLVAEPPSRERVIRAFGAPDRVVDLWALVAPPIEGVKLLARRCDQEAIKHGAVPEELTLLLWDTFARCESLLNEVLGDDSPHDDQIKAAVGARVQAELLPFLLMTTNAERWYSKPRGYAGDFLSIAGMYENEARGTGRLGPILDRAFLNLAAVRAVQNRRGLLATEIEATIDACGGRPARVMSLASGPAQELFDVYTRLPEPSALASTLIDIDLHALAYVADRRDPLRLKKHMNLLNENLVHLATGQRSLAVAPQDLVYSIGLIDYFTDDFVVKLMNFVHSALAAGGRAIFGNFHPRNISKGVMDHVLEWRLIHRTEEDMNRLFQRSVFGRPCARITFEPRGINMFAECVKA